MQGSMIRSVLVHRVIVSELMMSFFDLRLFTYSLKASLLGKPTSSARRNNSEAASAGAC